MAGSFDGRVRLAEYLIGLRAELSGAIGRNDQDDVDFELETATLEVDIAHSLPQSGDVELWVLGPAQRDLDLKPESAARDRQRLTLRLTPRPRLVPSSDPSEPVPPTLPWPHSPRGR
jgi:hypothetical protein